MRIRNKFLSPKCAPGLGDVDTYFYIDHMKALYQKFKLGSVSFDLDRPKMFVGSGAPSGPLLSQPTSHLGTQIIHSEVNIKPDGSTTTPVTNATIEYKLNATVPESWHEGVDNQSPRFNLHKDRKQVKASWRPTTEYERKWKDNTNSDQELATGGIHIRFKDKKPVPEIGSLNYVGSQVILQGYATMPPIPIPCCSRTARS
jgi:hypothetical protein